MPYVKCSSIRFAAFSFQNTIHFFPVSSFFHFSLLMPWKVEYHTSHVTKGRKSRHECSSGRKSTFVANFQLPFRHGGNNFWLFNAVRSFLFSMYYTQVILAADVSEPRIMPVRGRERWKGKEGGMHENEGERDGEKRERELFSVFKPIYAGKQGFRCSMICASSLVIFFFSCRKANALANPQFRGNHESPIRKFLCVCNISKRAMNSITNKFQLK